MHRLKSVVKLQRFGTERVKAASISSIRACGAFLEFGTERVKAASTSSIRACGAFLETSIEKMRRGAFVYFALVLALVALAFVLWKDTNCSPSVVNAGNRRDVDVAGLVPDRPNEDREAEDKLPVSLETKTAATNPTIKAHIVKQKQPKPKPKPKWNVFTTSEKYTIVVMTYKRDDLLKRFLIHYNQKSFPQLEKIVVIWNNIGVPLNEKEFIPNIPSAAPITFIVAKTNTLRNKMTPHPEVTTNGEG